MIELILIVVGTWLAITYHQHLSSEAVVGIIIGAGLFAALA